MPALAHIFGLTRSEVFGLSHAELTAYLEFLDALRR